MTDTLTDDKLQAIREGLEGVTPGPWHMQTSPQPVDGELDATIHSAAFPVIAEAWGRAADRSGSKLPASANAAHIARLDPDTVSALIARLDAAEGALREAGGFIAEIARQRLRTELSNEEYMAADWQGGYDACVGNARMALPIIRDALKDSSP